MRLTGNSIDMKSIIINGLLFLYALTVNSQAVPEILKPIRAYSVLSRPNLISGDMFIGIPYEPGEVVGDVYLTSYWSTCNILLYENDRLLEGMIYRYDIQRDEIELSFKNGVMRALDGIKVRSLVWNDSLTGTTRYIVNARSYKENGVTLKGFFEVHADGKVPLLGLTTLEILKPDFNPALNVGSRDVKIIKKKAYYYAHGQEVFRIKGKKNLEAAFSDKKEIMAKYFKGNSIQVKNESSLTKAFEYYNTLHH
jgi:hypothetical protein